MHPCKHLCTPGNALHGNDKPVISRTFLLLSSKIHPIGMGLQAERGKCQLIQKAQEEVIHAFHGIASWLHA